MPPNLTSDLTCQTCGTQLDPSILGGTCPACVWSDIIEGEQAEQSALSDAPEIEGYLIHEEIGQGGMGIVYRASQKSTGRDVALKIVAPFSLRAAEAKQRFLVEAQTMAAVNHPRLLPLFDTGEDPDGRPWLTMQLAKGGTLGERAKSYEHDWKKSASLLVELCQAVQYAHERGILHRDLKPANILFDDEENAYVSDFGLAKWADNDSQLTHSTSLLGSPAYLSPEAARGGSKESTTAGDIYSLGAILYELLTGKRPYEGEHAAQVLTKILETPPRPPRQQVQAIPRDLEVIVMKAMARDSAKRYQSAAAFANDLTRWLDGKIIQARPVGLLERSWIWARRNPALSILSLLLLASLLIGGILLWDANRKLTASLEEAEARVDFMTRELPAALAPVGRLDLLEDVFENVAEHYEDNDRTDPEYLARQADFLTNWSQIFLPRGQIDAAIERLEPAWEKAKTASEQNQPSALVARSRVSTGLNFAKALIQNRQLEKARTILNETTVFADAQGSDDPSLRILTARVAQQYMHLEEAAHKLTQATIYGEACLVKWTDLIPFLEGDIETPQSRLALVDAVGAHYILADIYQRLNLEEHQDKTLAKIKEVSDKLMSQDSSNAVFRFQLHESRVRALQASDQAAKSKRSNFLKIDADTMMLTAQNPGNIRWAHLTILTSLEISDLSHELQDYENYGHWLRVSADRLLPLYESSTIDLDLLMWQSFWAIYVAERLEYDDWRRARIHFGKFVDVNLKRCKLDTTPSLRVIFQEKLERVIPYLVKHEGQELADQWASQVQSRIEKELAPLDD